MKLTPRKGVGPSWTPQSGSVTAWAKGGEQRLPRPSCPTFRSLMVPLSSALRPTSEEALKWGESLEKLLLHKCKWGPVSCSPSLGSLPPSLFFLSETRAGA